MKTQVIETPEVINDNPIEFGTDRLYTKSKKKGYIKHSDMLCQIREKRVGKAIHSGGFLSLSHVKWENQDCSRGHRRIDKVCQTCGHVLTI